jgi:hypothetical protein
VPSTITVMNTDDSGAGSLRAAIEQANVDAAQDTITFAPTVTGAISLLTALPELSAGMNIVGPGPSALTVARSGADGTGYFNIFTVSAGARVAISGLKITGGFASYGGGIENLGTLSIADSTISGNTAVGAVLGPEGGLRGGLGGGIDNYGTLSITDSTISGNSASSWGGGIENDGAMSVTCSTYSGNEADVGGGIDNYYGTLSITDSTISGNSASLGGGIDNSHKASIVDTIVAGNTGSSSAPSDIGGGITGSNNLIGTGGSGGLKNGRHGNIVLKSLTGLGLSPLGDYGGPTQTMALLPNSPAIDAGIALSGVTTDQRGITRPQGSPPDIGAYEVAFSLINENPTVVSVQGAGVPDSTLLVLTFSEPMNANRADNLGNYRVDWTGPTHRRGATRERAIPIRFARYNAASQTVTLRPTQRLPLSGTGLLTVVGTPPDGLTNTSGIFLDGTDMGQPGSDYTATINP